MAKKKGKVEKNLKSTNPVAEYTRNKDKIRELWKATGKVEFSVTDHYVTVGGVTFNGVSRELFAKFITEEEEKVDE